MKADQYLKSLSPIPLMISWHENKSSYLFIRKERRAIFVRLHRLFERASIPVLDALIRYILKNDQKAKPILRKTVYAYFSNQRIPSDVLITKGRVYDLQVTYEKLKKQFFMPDYDAAIGWSKVISKTRFRHITFGSYDRYRHQIRIHPFLDDSAVPPYFLEFIIYHEMLHAVCEPQIDALGHSRSHTREFRQKEKLFPQYREAKEWEKNSLIFFKKRKSHGRA